MKHITKNGVLADKILRDLSDEARYLLEEQTLETKPSRISNKVFNDKKKKKRKDKYDYDD